MSANQCVHLPFNPFAPMRMHVPTPNEGSKLKAIDIVEGQGLKGSNGVDPDPGR